MVEHNVEISEITFLPDKKGIGKMMRCTVTWVVRNTPFGELGMTMSGCLVSRRQNGELALTPPKSQWKGFQRYLIRITNDLANYVLRLIAESKYNEHIGECLPDALRSKLPHEIDTALPLALSRSEECQT